MEAIYNTKNKITKINCLNKMFDPNFHQAMLEIEDDKVEPGTIIQEIQSGFMFGERLLRPSFVGISKSASIRNVSRHAIKPSWRPIAFHSEVLARRRADFSPR